MLAPLNKVGDVEGCRWSPDNTVTTPKGFKDAYAAMVEQGWPALASEAAYGGQGLPAAGQHRRFSEMSSAANMAFSMYAGPHPWGLFRHPLAGGSEANRKATYLPKLASWPVGQDDGTSPSRNAARTYKDLLRTEGRRPGRRNLPS